MTANRLRLLIIDPQFEGDQATVEAAVLGPDVEIEVWRPEGHEEVPQDALRRADAILNCRSRHRLPAHLVAAMDRARIVVQAGVGFNHIDVEACARRGIPVCNTPDYGTMEVADHAITLALSLLRGVTAYNNRLLRRDDAWSTLALPVAPVRRIRGLTFGIVGLGRIGLAAGLRARAFGFEIAFYDPYQPPGYELALGFRRQASLPGLLAAADVLSLHCPLTPETTRLIGHDAISQLKPGAILVNTARGGVCDLDAIEAGLRKATLCAAALDVLPTEPLDRSHPLLAAWSRGEDWLEGRLVLTPHAAFYTPESLIDMRRLSAQAVADFLHRGSLRACVNGPVSSPGRSDAQTSLK